MICRSNIQSGVNDSIFRSNILSLNTNSICSSKIRTRDSNSIWKSNTRSHDTNWICESDIWFRDTTSICISNIRSRDNNSICRLHSTFFQNWKKHQNIILSSFDTFCLILNIKQLSPLDCAMIDFLSVKISWFVCSALIV